MKSNYKRIGDFIRLVDERNTGLKVQELIGLTISKQFIPSVANTIGSDMENYKIIRQNQFACSLMQVRRDKKIPVALLKDKEVAIISQAYPIFEIINTKHILPEYLMMWFSRKEFDREACFYAVGGVRGSLEWEDFSNMKLPVPSIEKQKEIVKEYNVILNRIELNNQLIQKLEETAQAIYKQWFVDFEFPYNFKTGEPDLNGKPYKSNGGKMIDSEMGEIPAGWKVGRLGALMSFKNGKSKPSNLGIYPLYGGNGIIEYVSDYNFENVISIGRVGAYCGSLYLEREKCWISDNAIAGISYDNHNIFIFYHLFFLKLNERSEGTGQPLLTQELLGNIKALIPKLESRLLFEKILKYIFNNKTVIRKELALLIKMRELLLSKLATEGRG